VIAGARLLVWFGLLVLNGTFSTNSYIVTQKYEIYCAGPGDKTNTELNNETIQ